MYQIKIKINKNTDSQRLDLALAKSNLSLSRRKIKKLIDIGSVYVNKTRVRIASYIVHKGDLIHIEYNPDLIVKLKYQNFKITKDDIIFENDDLIVINKPPGLPSQPTREQALVHVIECIKNFYKQQNIIIPKNLILVHRLDKETSGVMLVAKNKKTARYLSQEFKNQKVQKVYHAICYGIPKHINFQYQSYLSTINSHLGIVRAVDSSLNGRFALTQFKVLKINNNLNISLIEAIPKTGRSHQIRVHLYSLGYPIVGDKKYSTQFGNLNKLPNKLKELINYHFLHSKYMGLSLNHKNEFHVFNADYPTNFKKFLYLSKLEDIQ